MFTQSIVCGLVLSKYICARINIGHEYKWTTFRYHKLNSLFVHNLWKYRIKLQWINYTRQELPILNLKHNTYHNWFYAYIIDLALYLFSPSSSKAYKLCLSERTTKTKKKSDKSNLGITFQLKIINSLWFINLLG